MKKGFLLAGCILTAALFCRVPLESQEAEDPARRLKAARALESGEYEKAARLCLALLVQNPDDFEAGFLLARAYAFSGQSEKALQVLNRMLEKNPSHADLLLLRSRVLSWKGDYEQAKGGYRAVLQRSPDNVEALTGLAEIASWTRAYPEAIRLYSRILEINPDSAEFHFRLGRVYLWAGNSRNARKHLTKAVRINPSSEEYRKALSAAFLSSSKKSLEVRYEHRHEAFSDGRAAYVDRRLVLSLAAIPRPGTLNLKWHRTTRFGISDTRWGIEAYPLLWHRAYGYIDLTYSPSARHFPRTAYLMEIYQSIFSDAEVSLGFRRMNFPTRSVSVFMGSSAYYFGEYYASLRGYYTPEELGARFSWILHLRKYIDRESYLFASYGRGSRPFEITTFEDIQVLKSQVFLAGWDGYILKHIRLRLQFLHRTEDSGLTRNAVFFILGFRSP